MGANRYYLTKARDHSYDLRAIFYKREGRVMALQEELFCCISLNFSDYSVQSHVYLYKAMRECLLGT